MTAARAYPEHQFVPQPWMDQAACRDRDPELWFAGSNGNNAEQARDAKKVCEKCPVAAACLTYAVEYPSPLYGIWGGTTEAQRDDIRRRRGLAQVVAPTRRKSQLGEEIDRLRSFGFDDELIAYRLQIKPESIQQRDRRAARASS